MSGNRVLEILLGVQDRKLRRDLRKARRDISGFAKSTSNKLRSSFKSAFGAIAGVGTVAGMASIGKNVLDVDKKLTRLGIQAGKSRSQMIAFHHELQDLSDDTGVGTEDLADAAARFVSLTGAYDQARRGAEVFAKTSAASGASLEDVAAAAASLKSNLGIEDIEGFQKGLSILLTQGKAGAVELRELAGLLPSLAPSFTQFGKSGTEGLAELGAALQVVRQGFGSGSEAATGMNALMTSIGRNARAFEKAGVKIFDRDPKTGVKRFRQFSQIVDAIGQSRLMRDPTKLTRAFGSSEARRAFMELHKGQDRFRALWSESVASTAVEDDFAAYMESNAGRIEKAWQRLQNTLARQLTPERIGALVRVFEDLGRAVGFVVANVKTIVIAFGALKLVQWSMRIHALAASMGGAGQATEKLAQAGGLLGTRGLSGVSKFASALSGLGSIAGVFTLGYQLGTLIDKALGLSDALVDVETRTPTASKYDPEARASTYRIFAAQRNESAAKQEKNMNMNRKWRPAWDKLDTEAAQKKLDATRAEAKYYERKATTVEVIERVRQAGETQLEGGVPAVGPVAPDVKQAILQAAIEHTGKTAGDPELRTILLDVLAELRKQSTEKQRAQLEAMAAYHALANMPGRAPAE